MESEVCFTVADVADKLRCHPNTVRQLIRQRKLKAFKVGVKWLVTPAALTDCITLLEKGALR